MSPTTKALIEAMQWMLRDVSLAQKDGSSPISGSLPGSSDFLEPSVPQEIGLPNRAQSTKATLGCASSFPSPTPQSLD